MWNWFSWHRCLSTSNNVKITVPKSLRKPRFHGAPNDTQVKWVLATTVKLLRETGRRKGLNIRPDGYINVFELLRYKKFRNFDLDRFVFLARRDPRARLHFKAHRQTLLVRAEGIKIPLVSHTTRRIDPKEYPELVYHTNIASWPKICRDGIQVNPHHHTPVIFLARRFPEMDDYRVDHTRTQVIIVIDVQKASDDGIKFFKRITQQIITPGDDRGSLPPQYFKYVMVRKWSKEVLLHPESSSQLIINDIDE